MIKLLSVRSFSLSRKIFSVTKNATGGINLVDKVVATDDGKMFIAWHPDVNFPYEYSKPIPATVDTSAASLLKENKLNTAMAAFRNKHPEVAIRELMSLTHTCKHRWYPRSRDKKAKKTPMDRPYL